MNITVLGARSIGGTLGKSWVRAGHRVVFGVRNVDNPEVQALVKSLGDRASVKTVSEAIALGEVVLFAIPGSAMDETIAANARALEGKIAIDPTNKMGAPVANSLATFAAQVPGAEVFRAFANYGFENFANPRFGDVQADLFYTGPGGDAQVKVEQLISDVGLRPIRLGDNSQAAVADSVGRLWYTLAHGQRMGRGLTLKVLTR
jgi:8-hydroxy-5-deazaflavin:NADPH oxidoreductase